MDPNDQNNNNQEQAEGIEQQPANSQPDAYSKRFESMDAAIAAQNRQLQAILDNVTAAASYRQQPASSPPQKPLKDMLLDEPDQFVEQIEQRAAERASRVIEQKVQASQATQNVVMEMQSKFPEFSQSGSEAARLAFEKASTLPKGLQGTPEGIRMAMQDAAIELGLVVASKRKTATSNDDFSVSNSSSQGRQAARGNKKEEVADATLEFARLLGVPINDPKRIAGLKKASKRTNWMRYQGEGEE